MHPFGRDHNQLLHELLDSLSDHAVYMLDLDGRVASWNTGAERLMGYSATEIDRQSYERFFRPEDRRTGVPGAILARAARDGRAEVEGWRRR
jgi:PAS domain S-box-containing protein